MLDGQGGDELFTGYTPYYKVFYSEAKKNKGRELLLNEEKHAFNAPLNMFLTNKSDIKTDMSSLIKRYMPKGLRRIIRKYFLYHESESKYILTKGKKYCIYYHDTLNQMLYNYMSYTSLPVLLKYEDRNSMRFSIESRTPFSDDNNLIEYIFTIPSVYKIHNGWSKYLLRESMRNFIPTQIIERTDKIGFETPEYEWLQLIKPFVFDAVSSDITSILKLSQIEEDWGLLIDQNKSGINDIWRYINFILWFKIFKVTL